MAIEAINNTTYAVGSYRSRNALTTYAQDGHLHTDIAITALESLTNLAEHWKHSIGPSSYGNTLLNTAWYISLASFFGAVWINSTEPSPNLETYYHATQQCLEAWPHLIDIATLTSYVAMGILGSTSSAGIGLAFFTLSVMKNHGYLPKTANHILDESLALFSAVAPFFFPSGYIFRFMHCAHVGSYVTSHLLPESLWHTIDPLPEHHIDPNKTIAANGEDALERLRLNRSSIYSRDFTTLPSDMTEALSDTSLPDLIARVEEKIPENGLDHHEREGFAAIQAYCLGACTYDNPSIQHEKFDLMLKVILSHLVNKDDSLAEIKEFSRIGTQCADGWFRELQYALCPESQNPRWHIHHQLATLRGELVREAFQQTMQSDRLFSHIIEGYHGGGNNVHLLNTLERTLRHRLRTVRGEILWHMERHHSLAEVLAYQFAFYSGYNTVLDRFLLGFEFPLIEQGDTILNRPLERYDTATIITCIYDAQKPQYKGEEDNTGFRAIPWSSISSLLAEINEHIAILNEETWEYREKWVARDDKGNSYLTQEGVQLLLWHLGILEPESCTPNDDS